MTGRETFDVLEMLCESPSGIDVPNRAQTVENRLE